jgi:hypothetical protein
MSSAVAVPVPIQISPAGLLLPLARDTVKAGFPSPAELTLLEHRTGDAISGGVRVLGYANTNRPKAIQGPQLCLNRGLRHEIEDRHIKKFSLF